MRRLASDGRWIFAVLTSVIFSSTLNAQETKALDASSAQALQQIQALLGDQKQVRDFAKTHPDAAKADANVQSLTGGNSEDSAAVYKLASDIFSNITKESGGDAGGMEQIMANAMKNPQSFADKLTPEQKVQLKSLTNKIEARSPTSNAH